MISLPHKATISVKFIIRMQNYQEDTCCIRGREFESSQPHDKERSDHKLMFIEKSKFSVAMITFDINSNKNSSSGIT